MFLYPDLIPGISMQTAYFRTLLSATPSIPKIANLEDDANLTLDAQPAWKRFFRLGLIT